MINAGRQIREGFLIMVETFGESLIVFKNFRTDNQKQVEYMGMSNNKKHDPSLKMFQFPEKLDLEIGDVIQQKGARSFWMIYEVEDHIIGGEFVYLEAFVDKINEDGSRVNVSRNLQKNLLVNQIINSPNSILAHNVKNSSLLSGNNSSIISDLHTLQKKAEADQTIHPEVLTEIKSCIEEISESLAAGIKPKSATEKLVAITAKIASISSFALAIGKTIAGIN